MKNYHQILKINKGADKKEIKKAYRKLALKYHPDINKDPKATNIFLSITEAYEMLMSPPSTFINFQQSSVVEKEEAIAKARKEAQEKAQAYAKMKRKEFMNSDAYKQQQAEIIFLDQLSLLFMAFLIFIMPPLFYILGGFLGLGGAILILLVSWAYWFDFFSADKKFSFEELISSFKVVRQTAGFELIFMFLFCLFSFFTVFVNTVLPHEILIYITFAWLTCFLLTFLISRFIGKGGNKIAYYFLIPMTISMSILDINYVCSYEQTIEEYTYSRTTQKIKGRTQQTTMIYLSNDAYWDSFAIRFFHSESVFVGQIIEYKFEKGLFGLKVLKNYSFHDGE